MEKRPSITTSSLWSSRTKSKIIFHSKILIVAAHCLPEPREGHLSQASKEPHLVELETLRTYQLRLLLMKE